METTNSIDEKTSDHYNFTFTHDIKLSKRKLELVVYGYSRKEIDRNVSPNNICTIILRYFDKDYGVFEDYKLGRTIGMNSNNGKVKLCYHIESGAQVAIKAIWSPAILTTEKQVMFFFLENMLYPMIDMSQSHNYITMYNLIYIIYILQKRMHEAMAMLKSINHENILKLIDFYDHTLFPLRVKLLIILQYLNNKSKQNKNCPKFVFFCHIHTRFLV